VRTCTIPSIAARGSAQVTPSRLNGLVMRGASGPASATVCRAGPAIEAGTAGVAGAGPGIPASPATIIAAVAAA
jgi:hypothetical protein